MDKGDVDPKQYVSVNGGLLVQELDVATKAVTADMRVTKAKPAAAADGGPEFRLAYRQAREVERHRGGEGRPDAGRGRRADEPHRLWRRSPCGRRMPPASPKGLVLASDGFLPLRRLRDAGRRIRRDGHRAAGRFGPRRGLEPGRPTRRGIANSVFTGERHFKH